MIAQSSMEPDQEDRALQVALLHHVLDEHPTLLSELVKRGVSVLENGHRYPCWDALCALSAAFEIRLSLLIGMAEDV
jgi:hypothetical protein